MWSIVPLHFRMTHEKFADNIGKELHIVYHPGQPQYRRYFAQFHHAETLEGSILTSAYGTGSTPEKAVEAYFRGIRGKTLVFNAHMDRREEFEVPDRIDVRWSSGTE